MKKCVNRWKRVSKCLLQYKLRLVASDNLNENYTTVIIHIKDVNDNPPTFDRPTYETQITEEDDRHVPKRILQVIAIFATFCGHVLCSVICTQNTKSNEILFLYFN